MGRECGIWSQESGFESFYDRDCNSVTVLRLECGYIGYDSLFEAIYFETLLTSREFFRKIACFCDEMFDYDYEIHAI